MLGLAVWGLSATFLNTPVNALAVAVERAHGSPLMSRFHASFSCGVLAGGAIGTLAAAGGVSPGEAVSVITIGQWPGFLLAGPVVGLLAGATSLRLALASLAVAGLGAAVLTRRISTV
ncbi:hypothetical protein ACGFY9_14335 [Streptomyces sp. NPDC048504]|uniref:hypothetical protein n=1 Tax=Streptomyces sp. NPDC048504 TaxID=3365559 RepID=UPI00372278D8